MLNWDRHKQIVLSKSDKSFKASIDEPILELVDAVNASSNFFTTSSCSGRIMLINEGDCVKRKNGASFKFVSHDIVSLEKASDLLELCTSASGNVFLKLEPLILHIESRTLDLGIRLLHLLKRENQFKHTCIVSATNEKYIVCVKAMVKLEIPLVYDSVSIVDLQLLRQYLEIANTRMAENFDAIKNLTRLIKCGELEKLEIVGFAPKVENIQVPASSCSSSRWDPVADPFFRIGDYLLSANLKTVVSSTGEPFGTIPSVSGSRPVADGLLIDVTVVSDDSFIFKIGQTSWSFLHFVRKTRPKFQWAV